MGIGRGGSRRSTARDPQLCPEIALYSPQRHTVSGKDLSFVPASMPLPPLVHHGTRQEAGSLARGGRGAQVSVSL